VKQKNCTYIFQSRIPIPETPNIPRPPTHPNRSPISHAKQGQWCIRGGILSDRNGIATFGLDVWVHEELRGERRKRKGRGGTNKIGSKAE
jgi:hypothetical protein